MAFRDWSGWSRLDDLDRRAGFSGNARPGRWVVVLGFVVLPVLWFIKGLTIGESAGESALTVLLIIGFLGIGALGLYAVERWLRGEIGDQGDRR